MTTSMLSPAAENAFISTLPVRIQAAAQARLAVQRGELFDVLAVCSLLKISRNALWKRIRRGSFPRPDVVINRNLQLWRRASLNGYMVWLPQEKEEIAAPAQVVTQTTKPAPTLWMRFLRKLNSVINGE